MNELGEAEGELFLPDRKMATLSGLERGKLYEQKIAEYRQELEALENDTSLTEAERGSRMNKLWCLTIQGLPTGEMQIRAVERFEEMIRVSRHIDPKDANRLLAGFKGEYATGVLMNHGDMTVSVSTEEWDLYGKTDFVGEFDDSRQIFVQAKTLVLPYRFRREGSEPLPIFSSLRTSEDLIIFKERLKSFREYAKFEIDDEKLSNSIDRIIEHAEEMHNQFQKLGKNPVICILGTPMSDYSDIDKRSCRATLSAEKQAKYELEAIYESLPELKA